MSTPADFLNPAQVGKILCITPDNVKRLAREGYLEVKGKAQFKNGEMDLFQKEQVESLLPVMPRIKQAWTTRDDYYYGARRQARARVYKQKSYEDKLDRKQEFLTTLELLREDMKKLLRACYYLFHLNHYAKAGNHYLYDLKEAVLHTFVRNYYRENNNLLRISFIEGDNKIYLCPACKEQAKNRRMDYLEYLDATGGCSRCTREYKYYSLYEFIISHKDYRFCFHVPYSTAKKWFKAIKLRPPRKPKPQREGAYAFGRAIYESEARAVELIEVITELQDFLAHFNIKPLFATETRPG